MKNNQIIFNQVCFHIRPICFNRNIYLIKSLEETTVSPLHQQRFGLDESFPPADQRWRSSGTSAYSPEKSESRLTTGDTGEISSNLHIYIPDR